jgi:excisionase family DNA binding protein
MTKDYISDVQSRDLLERINEGISTLIAINKRQQVENQTYLSMREAAEYIQIPISTLYQLVSKKKIPSLKVGRHNRFLRTDLDHWMRTKRREVSDEL